MITWRQWAIGSVLLLLVAALTPLLTFAKVIVTMAACGSFLMAFTGAVVAPDQKQGDRH